ncbi:MAG TPA: MgtC/SapB family protein, partial [Thermomicrobiales bacterium]|nr:MgtC/SapB family protein [Thermomicrobiales bacterium]
IGLERERLERAAGLRTHALVALASALVMIVSAYGFADVLVAGESTVLDPSRIAAQVVSGVGFLGAGVIILRKNTVRGLTTAASVWTVAGIGLACGGGLLAIAVVATLSVLIIQAVVRPMERRFFDHHSPQQIVMRVQRAPGRLAEVEASVAASRAALRGLRLRPARGGAEDRVELDLTGASSRQVSELIDALRCLDGVQLVEYTLDSPQSSRAERIASNEREDEE